MDTQRQATTEHLSAALKGIFTSYVLLQSTASAIQWQPPSVTRTLQQLPLNQTPIHDELRNHAKRNDLCQALCNILKLIEGITHRIAHLERRIIPTAKKSQNCAPNSEAQARLYQKLTDKLHQIRTNTFGANSEHFSPQWQLMQIRQAITRMLDERDVQDQLCTSKRSNETAFPANIQQLSQQIVHTQVTLKSLIQQQANLIIDNIFDTQQTPLRLDDALVANPTMHPIIIAVGIRSERPYTLHTGWLRAFAQHREKIKITYKKHEMRLQHLTPYETEQAKLISLLCQSELFRLLLKESTRKIDRAIIEVDALCDRLNALNTDQLRDTPNYFFAQCALLCQDSTHIHNFVSRTLNQIRLLAANTQAPNIPVISDSHPFATEA